jgi:transposase
VQRLQELQILQALCEGGRYLWSLQARCGRNESSTLERCECPMPRDLDNDLYYRPPEALHYNLQLKGGAMNNRVADGAGDGSMIGLPSLHALDHSQGRHIWLAAEATDMRCSFDRLAERVKSVIGQDPAGNSLFVFRSRRGDRLKILTWDRDGFVLWYKRLEAGVFKLPRIAPGACSIELRASELAMILDGIDMSKLKRVPRYERSARTNTINVQRVSA